MVARRVSKGGGEARSQGVFTSLKTHLQTIITGLHVDPVIVRIEYGLHTKVAIVVDGIHLARGRFCQRSTLFPPTIVRRTDEEGIGNFSLSGQDEDPKMRA